MTYSGALWGDNTTLEDAQLSKLDYHASQARAAGASRVLDVGCGWGSMMERLVRHHNVSHAVGLTLSEQQADWIGARRIPNVTTRIEHWADHQPDQPYDAIISIGALEHFANIDQSVDEKIASYRRFFSRCRDWLAPSGYMSIQAIAYGNLLRDDVRGQFVSREIFPESDFVRLVELVEATDFLFEIEAVRNDPDDYLRTCEEWLRRLQRNRHAAVAAAGEKRTDMWEKYLELSIAGWRMHATNLLRITLRRIDRPRRSAA